MCLRHRYLFGTRWRCNTSRCSIPTEVAAHKGKSSAPEAQYGLKRAYSAHVMSATNMLVQECSRVCLNGFLEKKILYLRDQCPSNFNTLGYRHSLFPLTGSRGKRTRKPASAKLPLALNSFPELFPLFSIWLRTGKSPGNEVDVTRVWSTCENRRPPQAIFTCTRVLF